MMMLPQSQFSRTVTLSQNCRHFGKRGPLQVQYIGPVFLFTPLEDKSGHMAQRERDPGLDSVSSFGWEKVFLEATRTWV